MTQAPKRTDSQQAQGSVLSNARAQPLLAEYLIEFLQPILDKP